MSSPSPALPKHGTESRYRHHGCRCARCKSARSTRRREWPCYGINPKRPYTSVVTHGTRSRYVYGCRCVKCREANRAYYHALKEAKAA